MPESTIWGVNSVKSVAGFLPFVLIALVFWLLIIRPQRRRQQDLVKTQTTLGPGVEVMLGSGIYGRVASVEDDTVHVEVSPGTTLKVAKQAVVKVLTPDAPDEAEGSQHDGIDRRDTDTDTDTASTTDPLATTEKSDEQHP
jgi:preprotein translocase subunit YajC